MYTDCVDYRSSYLLGCCRPVGMPHMEQVTVHNPDPEISLHLLSISGSTLHFHCSFFQDKVCNPQQPLLLIGRCLVQTLDRLMNEPGDLLLGLQHLYCPEVTSVHIRGCVVPITILQSNATRMWPVLQGPQDHVCIQQSNVS